MTRTLFRAHRGNRRLDIVFLLIAALGLLFLSCSDERIEPPTAPDPGYTQTITLASEAVSNGAEVSSTFTVANELAPITQPGQDQPARLFISAFIRPDADILWREGIVSDSIPDWEDIMQNYQVAIVNAQDDVANYTELADSCEANPDCPGDSLSELQGLLAMAEDSVVYYQDLLAAGQTDTTRLGLIRDSLAVVLDDRYTLSIQFDSDPLEAYPGAVYMNNEMQLAGQNIHLVNTTDGVKGKGFTIDLARFNAADPSNIGRPIEVNWTTCFAGGTRPCMSPGEHTFTFRLNGPDTWVSAQLVLVYAEER